MVKPISIVIIVRDVSRAHMCIATPTTNALPKLQFLQIHQKSSVHAILVPKMEMRLKGALNVLVMDIEREIALQAYKSNCQIFFQILSSKCKLFILI